MEEIVQIQEDKSIDILLQNKPRISETIHGVVESIVEKG